MSRVVISGASGGVHVRKEIYEFVTDAKQLSLFIQALSDLENLPWKDQLSFFALGGIHGYPYVPWGDQTGSQKPTQWNGYCTHGTVLFPTWHRPYVAAVEQFIHDHAVTRAKEYKGSDASQWVDAANKLRMPYWDWASKAVPPPEVIEYETIKIVTPTGEKTVANPLYQFTFKESVKDFPQPYNRWQKTLRHPTNGSESAGSNVADLKRTLNANYQQTRASIEKLLTLVHDWPQFSNHTADGSVHVSLEGIHDSLHNFIGGGGHMASVPVAGFDPIFYLHHCNVDRFLSIWAALNPQVWVTPGKSEDGTFTIPANTSVDARTNLTPFANTQTSYWVSSELRSTDALQYTYADVLSSKGTGIATVQEIVNRMNALYGGAAPTPRARVGQPQAAEVEASLASAAPAPAAPTNHNVYDWKVRIRAKEFELGESFQVLIFLGPVPPAENYKEWMSHPTYVGCFNAFVNSTPELCENCSARPDKVLQGTVYLSESIAEKSGLPGSLAPEVVAPYLQENLSWSVRKVLGGEPVPLSELPSLEVTVFSTLLTKEEGSAFPTLGEHIHHRHITRGKLGGHRLTDGEEA